MTDNRIVGIEVHACPGNGIWFISANRSRCQEPQMRRWFNSRLRAAAVLCGLPLAVSFAAEPGRAEPRKPTARQISAIRDCADRNADNLDEAERRCLFNLAAEPCINKPPGNADNAAVADCYRMEAIIWDGLLNENYRSLLDSLDDGQAAKAREMQRAWRAYRDTTCQFYDDKIQGSLALTMHAACVTRELARRAMLLRFFSRL